VAKLLRKRKKLTETEAQSILKQLLAGYRDLHELGIVHRDLKLANVFVRRGQVKLADFGFAIPADRCLEKFDYNVGSPYYMPPESLKFNRYSFKSDVWSLGVIAYEMVFGRLPWKEKVETVLYDKITATPLEDLLDADTPLSETYRHFLFACLQVDYERRATPEQLFGF
jgi:serine/threonine protein kinase